MKIMFVAPGPLQSTFDVYNYYVETSRQHNDIETTAFAYHNILMYHDAGLRKMVPGLEPGSDTFTSIVYSRASRELLLDVILNKPDIVLFIAGQAISKYVYVELLKIRKELDRKFVVGIYFTESPYMDDAQSDYVPFADVLFVNDLYSLKAFDPESNKHVYYLPHSYFPKVHHPGKADGEEYVSDVLFCGTAFYERIELLLSVDWQDINLKLIGDWKDWIGTEKVGVLEPYIIRNTTIKNDELAKYYRGAKIALNIHRTRPGVTKDSSPINNYTDAYSAGPRIYEAIASGALLITDYRKEVVDLFGDTIEIFEGNEQLKEKISYWTDPAHEQERQNKIQAALKKIEPCTFQNRFENILLPTFREVLDLRRKIYGQ